MPVFTHYSTILCTELLAVEKLIFSVYRKRPKAVNSRNRERGRSERVLEDVQNVDIGLNAVSCAFPLRNQHEEIFT
jgi:hypothetical protein